MDWSGALNVAIGLTLVYLAFSVAASRINEFVASHLQWRADGLGRALYTMLGGPKASPSTSVAAPLDGEPAVPAAPPQPAAAPFGCATVPPASPPQTARPPFDGETGVPAA